MRTAGVSARQSSHCPALEARWLYLAGPSVTMHSLGYQLALTSRSACMPLQSLPGQQTAGTTLGMRILPQTRFRGYGLSRSRTADSSLSSVQAPAAPLSVLRRRAGCARRRPPRSLIEISPSESPGQPLYRCFTRDRQPGPARDLTDPLRCMQTAQPPTPPLLRHPAGPAGRCSRPGIVASR